MTTTPRRPRKGRGALTNPAGRFEPREFVPEDDGWGILEEEPPALPTIVMPEITRTIIDAGALLEDITYTAMLVASGSVAREQRKQVALLELLVSRGADPSFALGRDAAG